MSQPEHSNRDEEYTDSERGTLDRRAEELLDDEEFLTFEEWAEQDEQ